MWTTNILKKRFYEYFERNGHTTLPSSSVIPKNDPTLLFTNSGMVQFKNIFMGEYTKYKRVCTSQNCIRAGGKHNDLDDVGKDNYHHTFFEMLGNWSFGDYFKEEAIKFAYEFLIEELKLDKNNMYVTYYEEMDKESAKIWGKYLDSSRIIPSSYKDNFWEMGEYGPCGPCTEIHYDRIGNRDASSLVNTDDPNVLEIWNIVFMEYERTPKGLEPLKVKNIDTGIGLERLLSILMGVKSNYLIDSFQHLIKFIETKAGVKYSDGPSLEDVAFRVLSDHARTLAVCLKDKVSFSSEGVGYVVRRILRRAVRYAHDILKLEVGQLSQLVEKAAEFMGFTIEPTVIDAEEELFLKTLFKGKQRFIKVVEEKGKLDGGDVFVLYDTYGFPKDLTELMAGEMNVPISLDGFDEARQKARELSRSSKSVITINFGFEKTNDSFKYQRGCNGIEAELMAAVYHNEIVSSLPRDEVAHLVFDRTCFYGECGGQVGDKGVIEFLKDGSKVGTFEVADTQIQRGYVLHVGTLDGELSSKARLYYDEELRNSIAANHSTVHILNYFLRTYIHTRQEGSLVDASKCRLDFEGKKLSEETLLDLENKINAFVSSNAEVVTTIHPKEEVLEDESIIKMDGEEYPDIVRVINMSNGQLRLREICGGTHVCNTSEIRKVRLLSESGVKANTRRIIAVSGKEADKVDGNAKELFRQMDNLSLVSTECNLSISDRRAIEAINRENSKRLASELKNAQKMLETTVREKISDFKSSAESKNTVFIYEATEISKFDKKDIKKILLGLNSIFISENLNGLAYAEKDDDVLITAYHEDLNKLYSMINNDDFRIIKNSIQGETKSDRFDLSLISSLFSN